MSDITFSSQKVVGGDLVTITGVATNVGGADASGVEVRFLIDGVQQGPDQDVGTIPAGDSATAQILWDTKHLKGTHTITVIVDPDNTVAESSNVNNDRTETVLVRGNKVRNPSFEASTSGTSPDNWSSSGETAYVSGGSDGERSVATAPAGSWTSDAIDVTAGSAHGVSVDAAGAGGTLVLEQLSATGALLSTVTQLLSVADDGAFHTVSRTFTVADGVTQVRVKLNGPLVDGIGRFDDVRLWEE